ncbi:hypothetical protein BN1708_013067 [Verticillium longisporum]|uniref:Uncharacterized protein n=1 Tax=Verticillium longisporum TaxID=100787 RepID=A0A0G4LH31_VERLO|nr:hypothetical protein BN1708_013067 [Verticillium longisporum]
MSPAIASSSAAASPDLHSSLEDAVRDFQSILTDQQRSKLNLIGAIQGADTVATFTAQLDKENQLKKGRSVANRLRPVLDSVQAFSTVIGTFVSSHPEIAALVWGSVKLAMLLVVNYTSYFESLSGLFMAFSGQCPRFAEYQALYPGSTQLQKALCDFHASIIRCCKHVVEAMQSPWHKQLLQCFKQEFEPDLEDMRNTSKEVKAKIDLAITHAEHRDQHLQEKERAHASKFRSLVKKVIPEVQDELETMKKMQLEQSMHRSREERQQLLVYLSSHDYKTPFQIACKKHQYNTAEWIFTTPEFERWHDGTGPSLLWCSGKIGSGKTILCANVINHVLVKKGSKDRVTYFFLQYDESNSLMAETMIRSIIRQSIDPTASPEQVESQIKDLRQKPFVQLNEWASLFRKRIEGSSVFFIFIDGLDECDATERRASLDVLSSLATGDPRLRIFITSRGSVDKDLRDRFPRMGRVSMTSDCVASDIRLYIDAVVDERVRDGELAVGDPLLLETIKETLSEHADGMFLWVKFLISDVCNADCDDDIRESLRNLPKDLEAAFTRALSRIVSRQKMIKLVQKVFQWVAVAVRPMTLHEIREAVSIEIGQPYWRPERLVRDLSPIASWCENLLQITEEEPVLLQFAHNSIREFITGADLSAPLAEFRVDSEEADHSAGEICVTFLHLNDFTTTIARRQPPVRLNATALVDTVIREGQRGDQLTTRFANLAFRHRKAEKHNAHNEDLVIQNRADDDKTSNSLYDGHPFLRYAAQYWISHTSTFQEGKSTTWRLWQRIIMDEHSLALMPWQYSFRGMGYDILDWSLKAHHYALMRCVLRLPRMFYVDKDIFIRLSASHGDINAVTILMEDGEYSMDCINNALRVASEGGHLHVVEKLLDAKADVNAVTAHWGETALQAASGGGHLHVVETLLAAKADVNAATAYRGRTALQAASEGGHLHVVELLLIAKADVNAAAASAWGRTALQAASEGGHLHVVERLLAASADVNAAASTRQGKTALEAAVRGGYDQVVSRLIAAGAKSSRNI